MLFAVKLAHTVIAAILAGLILFALWRGVRGGPRVTAWLAVAIVGAEALVLALNDWTCPLYDLAARLTPQGASVNDIFLPRWAAAHIPHVFGPLYLAAVVLLAVRSWRAHGRSA